MVALSTNINVFRYQHNCQSLDLNLNPILLHRVLNSVPGELLLDQTSQVIHTPTNRANRQSLRGIKQRIHLYDSGKGTLISANILAWHS